MLIDELIGTFLIRESEHYPGDLTLSIKDDAKIQHYRVKLDAMRQTYTVDDEIFFPDLRLLVEVGHDRRCLVHFDNGRALALRTRRRWFVLSIGEGVE